MKKFKRFIFGSLFFVMLITITGCSKTALTPEEFKTKMQDKGYIVQDATDQMSQYDYIKQVYIAVSSDYTYQIEFYETIDNNYASKFFETNKNNFENNISSATKTTVNGINNNKFTVSEDESYKVISRVDNTAIYLNISSEYKTEVKDILKYLGY